MAEARAASLRSASRRLQTPVPSPCFLKRCPLRTAFLWPKTFVLVPLKALAKEEDTGHCGQGDVARALCGFTRSSSSKAHRPPASGDVHSSSTPIPPPPDGAHSQARLTRVNKRAQLFSDQPSLALPTGPQPLPPGTPPASTQASHSPRAASLAGPGNWVSPGSPSGATQGSPCGTGREPGPPGQSHRPQPRFVVVSQSLGPRTWIMCLRHCVKP